MIRYLPSKLLKEAAPEKLVKRLVNKDLTLNRAVLATLAELGFIPKGDLEETALKVIQQYKERLREERKDGTPKAEALELTLNDKAQMVQRVQNAVILTVKDSIKEAYRGEYYEWLPSDANEPDPLHQLKYGKTYQIGKGEMPGDRWGCRCGMNILVSGKTLQI